MNRTVEKSELRRWADEPTPRFMGGTLQESYGKGVDKVKATVRECLAHGGGGQTELRKRIASLLAMEPDDTLGCLGMVDGIRDACKAAALRMADLQPIVEAAMKPGGAKGRKVVVKKPGTRKSSLTNYQKNLAKQLYYQGYTLKDIGKRIDRGTAAVSYFFKVNGIERRGNNGKGQ